VRKMLAGLSVTFGLLPLLSVSSLALTHTVVKGDHLWGLAGHYYKNNFRWKVIYAANQDKIKDPHWIYPGQVFEIPEVPGPEIGELPARPVEASPAATPVPMPPDTLAAARPNAEPPPEITDDLSTKMPDGLTGQYPSMSRVKEAKGWAEDGSVTEFEGRELLAAEGDWFQAKMRGPASVGDRFQVLRRAAPQELDADPKAVYLQPVGWAQVKSATGGKAYRLIILKSGDTVQVGDLLKKEAVR
jgi:hypothetical protein